MTEAEASTSDERPRPKRGRFKPGPGLVRAAWILGVALAVLAPLFGRAAWEGRAEMEAAQAAAAQGDLEGQMRHLGRAARWRLPLARHDEEAIAALLALGEQLEARGPEARETALVAYREARRALISTRAWGVPQPEALQRANERIAALMAAQELEFSSDLSTTGEQEAWHRAKLFELPGPTPWRANLAALAFVAWVGVTVGFILFAIDAHGRLRPRPAVRWGILVLLLLVAWMVLTRLA